MHEVLRDPVTLVQRKASLLSADFSGRRLAEQNTPLLPPISDFHSFRRIYLNSHQEGWSPFGWTEAHRIKADCSRAKNLVQVSWASRSHHTRQIPTTAKWHSNWTQPTWALMKSGQTQAAALGEGNFHFPMFIYANILYLILIYLYWKQHVWGNGTSAVITLKCLYCRYLEVVHGRVILYLPQTLKTQSVSDT